MNVDISKMAAVLGRAPHCGDDLRVPFFQGGWLIATNGHAMVAVRADSGEPYKGPKKSIQEGSAVRIIDVPLGEDSLPIASLRAVSVSPPLNLAHCEKCKSVGRIACGKCDGDGETECSCMNCGDDHTARCEACGGTGGPKCDCGWPVCVRAGYPPQIVVGEGTYSAELIGEFLLPVTAETFRFVAPTKTGAWVIGGDDWRVAFMPMRSDEKGREKAQEFELPAKVVAA
jgi:hypothetical protein